MTSTIDDSPTDDEITFTDAIRAALRAEIRRTGITAIRLLKGRRDRPHRLDARTVNRWLAGIRAKARRSDLDYVTRRWAELPDDPGRVTTDGRKLSRRGARHPAADETWIDVTPAMAAHLRSELARTGIRAAVMLRGVPDLPTGLNQRVIYGWLYGETRTTDEEHWAFVVALLRTLPDRMEAPSLRQRSEPESQSSKGSKSVSSTPRCSSE